MVEEKQFTWQAYATQSSLHTWNNWHTSECFQAKRVMKQLTCVTLKRKMQFILNRQTKTTLLWQKRAETILRNQDYALRITRTQSVLWKNFTTNARTTQNAYCCLLVLIRKGHEKEREEDLRAHAIANRLEKRTLLTHSSITHPRNRKSSFTE